MSVSPVIYRFPQRVHEEDGFLKVERLSAHPAVCRLEDDAIFVEAGVNQKEIRPSLASFIYQYLATLQSYSESSSVSYPEVLEREDSGFTAVVNNREELLKTRIEDLGNGPILSLINSSSLKRLSNLVVMDEPIIHQLEVDLQRIGEIRLDGNIIYNNKEPSKYDVVEVYKSMIGKMGPSFQRAQKLLCQAAVGDLTVKLTFDKSPYSNLKEDVSLSGGRQYVQINCDETSIKIVFRIVYSYKSPEKGLLAYQTVKREFTLPKDEKNSSMMSCIDTYGVILESCDPENLYLNLWKI